jgi:Phage integrase, N-terminal SAM-like domain
MTTGLAVIAEQVAPLPALPAADIDRAASYAMQDKAPATRSAYRSDFARFQAFCISRGVASLPATPETVAAYLASEAESGLKPSTVSRRCAAIRCAHQLAGHEPPTNSEAVKATLRGIRRSIGAAPVRKAPAVAEIMRDMAHAAPTGIKGCGIARCYCWASAGPSGAPNSWR